MFSSIHPKTDLWNELFVETPIPWPFYKELIEGLWPKLVSSLSDVKDIAIAKPTEDSWFHIRRSPCNGNEIDLLRVRDGTVSDNDKERIRLLAEKNCGINQAKWRRWTPEERHDNAFLAFLQKLSVLRTRDGICYNKYLAQISNIDYSKCPFCQEAYKVMKTPSSEWYVPLIPWFDYMSETGMDDYRTYKYAHWFGHILSGWPDKA